MFSLLLAGTLLCTSMPVCVYAESTDKTLSGDLIDITQWESDHPPLSDALKKAIALYKNKPGDKTEKLLIKALNDAYDQIIETKVKNREGYIKTRTSRIKGWMELVLDGEWPSFMLLNTDNNKAEERQAVADAVNAYWAKRTNSGRAAVKAALNEYYDAFLKEQDEIVQLTKDAREERIAASLAYYTSDLFKINRNGRANVNQNEALVEIICDYISVGAEIVYCNPEARVRERDLNSAIINSRTKYISEETDEAYAEYENTVLTAFETAYEVRLECIGTALNKGKAGAELLFDKMLDPDYITDKFNELIEQHNIYGRIDRVVTFGNNTYGTEWTPRMKEKSLMLADVINKYNENPTDENRTEAEEAFCMIYDEMLELENEQLTNTESKLDIYAQQMAQELLGQ